jgi:hypothetical protein
MSGIVAGILSEKLKTQIGHFWVGKHGQPLKGKIRNAHVIIRIDTTKYAGVLLAGVK